MRSICLILFSVLALAMGLVPADAGPILDRIRAAGVVHCGSFERPGIAVDYGEVQAASADQAGQEPTTTPWHGLAVDLCRAMADAVLGSPDKIAFHSYDEADDLAALSAGEDDVAFLTASEMHAAGVIGKMVPGPAMFIESVAVMVPAADGARHLADVDAGKGICFMTGSSAERLLSAYFEATKTDWRPHPYTEEGEMLDAYDAQSCHAIAGERTALAMMALEGGANGLKSVILPDALEAYPILSATSLDDGAWTSIVAWTVHTLMAGDRPSNRWTVGGVSALPVPLTDDGLDADWQKRLIDAFGSYGALIDRNLGAKSPLDLPAGLNALPERGGALVAPFLD